MLVLVQEKRLGREEVKYVFYALGGMHEANMAYTNACLPVLEFLSKYCQDIPSQNVTGRYLPMRSIQCLGVRNDAWS